jgi:hypothetical protein
VNQNSTEARYALDSEFKAALGTLTSGQQTFTVIAVDPANGIMILKHEGSGIGSFECKNDVAMLKRDGM